MNAAKIGEYIHAISCLRVGERAVFDDATHVSNAIKYIQDGSPKRDHYVYETVVIRLLDKGASAKTGRPTTYKFEAMALGEERRFDIPKWQHINVRNAARRAAAQTGWNIVARSVGDAIVVTRQPSEVEKAVQQHAQAALGAPAAAPVSERRAIDRRDPEPVVVAPKKGFDEVEF